MSPFNPLAHSDSLALAFPTCVLYVVDTTRCSSPATFMSNMLYACSILYKTKLPFVLCFNKCDISSSELLMQWMKDWDVLHTALNADQSYMSNLTRSMSLVLQKFYETLTCVSCSAMTGQNIQGLLDAIDSTREEYYKDYLEPLQKRILEKHDNFEKEQDEAVEAMKKDRKKMEDLFPAVKERGEQEDRDDENEWSDEDQQDDYGNADN